MSRVKLGKEGKQKSPPFYLTHFCMNSVEFCLTCLTIRQERQGRQPKSGNFLQMEVGDTVLLQGFSIAYRVIQICGDQVTGVDINNRAITASKSCFLPLPNNRNKSQVNE